MILAACLLLTTGGGLAEDLFLEEERVLQEAWELGDFTVEPYIRARVGGWGSGGFEFEAARADGKRKIDGRGLVFGGAEVGTVIADRILLFGTYEYATGGDLTIEVVGLSAGWRMPIEISYVDVAPTQFSIFAGAIFGAIEIDQENFGRVADDVGFRAGISLGWELSDSLLLDLFVELRVIDFEYRSPLLGGDDRIGGGGVAAGFSLEWGF